MPTRGAIDAGHNRYRICQRLGVTYRMVEIDLPDRNAALIWIIRNQFAGGTLRRSLARSWH